MLRTSSSYKHIAWLQTTLRGVHLHLHTFCARRDNVDRQDKGWKATAPLTISCQALPLQEAHARVDWHRSVARSPATVCFQYPHLQVAVRASAIRAWMVPPMIVAVRMRGALPCWSPLIRVHTSFAGFPWIIVPCWHGCGWMGSCIRPKHICAN